MLLRSSFSIKLTIWNLATKPLMIFPNLPSLTCFPGPPSTWVSSVLTQHTSLFSNFANAVLYLCHALFLIFLYLANVPTLGVPITWVQPCLSAEWAWSRTLDVLYHDVYIHGCPRTLVREPLGSRNRGTMFYLSLYPTAWPIVSHW